MLKTSEILEWLKNITNPTHELIIEINNAIYKDTIVSNLKSDIESALKNSTECDYFTVREYGENKELSAIENLCKKSNLKDAKYFIVIISQNDSLTPNQTNKMSDIIKHYINPNIRVIIGNYTEERVWDDIKITGMILK